MSKPGPVAQFVLSPAADPVTASSILARSHSFRRLDNIIAKGILLLLLVCVKYKQNYVHKVLVNRLVKFVLEEVGSGQPAIST